MKKILILCFALAATACTIHQEVQPLAYNQELEQKVCIVDNPDVKEGFVEAYRSSLEQKGFAVEALEEGASLSSCDLTSTYTANWLWDMALYMAYAEIKVYQEATPVAEAVYDSRRGGANMNKFIDAEAKVDELVDLLFPWPAVADAKSESEPESTAN